MSGYVYIYAHVTYVANGVSPSSSFLFQRQRAALGCLQFLGALSAKNALLVNALCSVRRSVTAQQAGLDPEGDTERTVNMVMRHGTKP
jgi:hypothetical protein